MRAAKVDRNHGEIVQALRAVGCSVQSLATVGKGCPDLLVGFSGKNYLLEVKDGKRVPSERRLTADEQNWHDFWAGSVDVANNVVQAMAAIGIDWDEKAVGFKLR